MKKPYIGLYVDERDEHAAFLAQNFINNHVSVLSSYIILVSERTRTICRRAAADWGIDLDTIVFQSPQSLRGTMIALKKNPLERILLFVDAKKRSDEFWILRDAAAEHGQKLIINRAAHIWADGESALHAGLQPKAQIDESDSVIIVGGDGCQRLEKFTEDYLETFNQFHPCIFASKNDLFFSGSSLPRSWFWQYFDPNNVYMNRKFCNVISCAGRNSGRTHGEAVKQFLETCANPSMRTNLLLTEPTALEWVQRFQPTQPQFITVQ